MLHRPISKRAEKQSRGFSSRIKLISSLSLCLTQKQPLVPPHTLHKVAVKVHRSPVSIIIITSGILHPHLIHFITNIYKSATNPGNARDKEVRYAAAGMRPSRTQSSAAPQYSTNQQKPERPDAKYASQRCRTIWNCANDPGGKKNIAPYLINWFIILISYTYW